MEERRIYFLYHPQKVIEDTLKEPDLVPVRLFALLFPLWRVELEGTFREQKPYALLEEYFERGIAEAQLQTTEELSAFFGIDSRLVAKVLDFLQTIEHVQYAEGRWFLRPLGLESLREGQKYIAKKNRQEYYFEALQNLPLTREHYEKMQVYTEQEADELVKNYDGTHRGYRCERPFNFSAWNAGAVADLARRSDRDQYNLRKEIRGVHQVSQPELVYLPMYLIEARKQHGQRVYLAYSRIRGRRDEFFERIVNTCPDIREPLAITAAKEQQERRDPWAYWLKKQGLSNLRPLQMPNGIWQLNLPAGLFRSSNPPLPIEKIGTYYLEEGHFLYLWCEDIEIRRNAVLDRTLHLIGQHKKSLTEREVVRNLQLLSEQLATRALDLNDLKRRAGETKRTALLNTVDVL
jgi:hypothetical protein